MRALLGRFTTTLLVVLAAGLPPLLGLLSPQLTWGYVAAGLVLIVAASGIRDYRQNVKPHVDFVRKRKYFFDWACKRAMKRLREFDDTARLNVMEIDWRLPRKKWGRFRSIYHLNMEGARDFDMGLQVNQGVAGKAVHTKAPYIGDLEAQDAPSFYLNPDQREKTKDLTLIISVPIDRLEKKADGEFHPSGDIVGVLNIDSKLENALAFYEGKIVTDEGTTLREEIEEAMVEISLNCSWILS
jgi:hypothetical protein